MANSLQKPTGQILTMSHWGKKLGCVTFTEGPPTFSYLWGYTDSRDIARLLLTTGVPQVTTDGYRYSLENYYGPNP